MTIQEIFEEIIDQKLSYSDAMKELNRIPLLTPREKDDYTRRIEKLCSQFPTKQNGYGNALPMLPNHAYGPLLLKALKLIRLEYSVPEISLIIRNEYGIDDMLIQYFINEAFSIYRMNTLTDDEIKSVVGNYLSVLAAEALKQDEGSQEAFFADGLKVMFKSNSGETEDSKTK